MSSRQAESPHTRRLLEAQRVMNLMGADVLVVGLGNSMRYFTGFADEPGERLFLLLVPKEGDPRMVLPKMYESQVRAAASGVALRAWEDGDDARNVLSDEVRRLGPTLRTALVDDQLWSAFVLLCQSVLPETRFESASALVSSLRIKKDPAELAALARAAAIADEAFDRVSRSKLAGLTEAQIALKITSLMTDSGGEGVAFRPIVASGPNSAFPHHRAGDRVIRRGDVVVIDYGCLVNGYCSDITRTAVCGRPPEGFEEVYRAVVDAQQAALEAAQPGSPAHRVDAAARDVLTRRGLGGFFIHRTGHGIGLDVHEAPEVSPGSDTILQAGMAFSIEPGIYLDGLFGVRIEDIVVVEESRSNPLNKAHKELVVVR